MHSSPSVSILSHRNSSGFLEAVSARTKPSREDVSIDDRNLPRQVIEWVDDVRTEFYSRHRNLRVGFTLMLRMQTFLRSNHHKGLDWSGDLQNGSGLCEAMLDALRGSLMRDVKHLGMIAKYVSNEDYNSAFSLRYSRKLKRDELRLLLETLYGFFHELPSNIRTGEQEPRTHLIEMQSQLSVDSNETLGVASRFSEWVMEYLG